jgi:hypothetical protein
VGWLEPTAEEETLDKLQRHRVDPPRGEMDAHALLLEHESWSQRQHHPAGAIVVSTLAEAEFFAAGGHRAITFGSPVIPWCAPPLHSHTLF